jgi:predicted MFS family arabinose efflux permease
LAAVSAYTHPHQRPQSIGIFRLWRDLGYAIGAILTGLIADQFGLMAPVLTIGLLTLASSAVVRYRMGCSKKTFESKGVAFSIRGSAL